MRHLLIGILLVLSPIAINAQSVGELVAPSLPTVREQIHDGYTHPNVRNSKWNPRSSARTFSASGGTAHMVVVFPSASIFMDGQKAARRHTAPPSARLESLHNSGVLQIAVEHISPFKNDNWVAYLISPAVPCSECDPDDSPTPMSSRSGSYMLLDSYLFRLTPQQVRSERVVIRDFRSGKIVYRGPLILGE